MLFALVSGWILCLIFTETNVFPTNPAHPNYKARTDIRSNVIVNAPWCDILCLIVFFQIKPISMTQLRLAHFVILKQCVWHVLSCLKRVWHVLSFSNNAFGTFCLVSNVFGTFCLFSNKNACLCCVLKTHVLIVGEKRCRRQCNCEKIIHF